MGTANTACNRAVIGPDGSVIWLCVPRWDSPGGVSWGPAPPHR
jgi:hypothetical protein